MKKKVLIFSLVFLVFFIVIISNFKLLLFDKDFYFEQYQANDVYKKMQTNHYELSQATFLTVSYLTFAKEGMLELNINGIPILTYNEQLHMNDVRLLMQRLLALLKIAYVSFIALILANINWFNKHGLKKVFTYSGISLIAFCILFVFSMKLNFSATFETFHMLFFSGNYNFPATSKLLQLFPGGFFFAAGKRILLNSFMIGIGFLGFGYLVPKKI